MTFEFIDTAKKNTLMIISTEPVKPVPTLKACAQPWLKALFACICLTQGIRLLAASDPIATLMGVSLLISVPSCCYFLWKDYQGLRQSRAGSVVQCSSELRKIA